VDLAHANEALTRAPDAVLPAAGGRGHRRAREAALEPARDQLSLGLRFAKGVNRRMFVGKPRPVKLAPVVPQLRLAIR